MTAFSLSADFYIYTIPAEFADSSGVSVVAGVAGNMGFGYTTNTDCVIEDAFVLGTGYCDPSGIACVVSESSSITRSVVQSLPDSMVIGDSILVTSTSLGVQTYFAVSEYTNGFAATDTTKLFFCSGVV